jgi:hypothetical protein
MTKNTTLYVAVTTASARNAGLRKRPNTWPTWQDRVDDGDARDREERGERSGVDGGFGCLSDEATTGSTHPRIALPALAVRVPGGRA